MNIILASNSRYKRAQMQSLGLTFTSVSPIKNEYHDKTIPIELLSLQLAEQKAIEIQQIHPRDIVIGSDQTAEITSNQYLLSKPGTKNKAIKQLTMCSGKNVKFYSAVSLMGPNTKINWTITTEVSFRILSEQEIIRYVDAENPIDCAGSFKIESLGISLFDKVSSDDPTALIGLPLLSLAKNLRSIGFSIP